MITEGLKTIARNEGFDAQASETAREDNPYFVLVKEWDDGWCHRKTMELRHRLEGDKIEELGTVRLSYGQFIHGDA